MDAFKSRLDNGNRMNMVLGAVHQVAAIAIIAIIVFGDVANAADGIKRLVAFDVGAAVHFAGCYYNFRL
jgi:hypothetical protein